MLLKICDVVVLETFRVRYTRETYPLVVREDTGEGKQSGGI
jgi:hypothetical protein